jgi:hypothetical protein
LVASKASLPFLGRARAEVLCFGVLGGSKEKMKGRAEVEVLGRTRNPAVLEVHRPGIPTRVWQ